MAGTLADLFVKIGVNTAGFDSGINRIKTGLQGVQSGINGLSTERLQAIGTGARNVGAAMTAAGAVGIAAFGSMAGAATDFESAIAGVKKTLGDSLSPEQFQQLTQELQNLSTQIPATANELAGIAEIAGQLGVDPSNVIAFTRVIADLGTTTDLASEEAAVALAQLINISSATQEEVSNVGSAIAELGNNAATSESKIVNMSTRIALSGTQAGLSTADILGFSAALAEAGVSAELGGTNFSKFISFVNSAVTQGGGAVSGFADVAGVTIKEFERLFAEDAARAVSKFLEGLNQISASKGDVFSLLDGMGFKAQETQRAILALATRSSELSVTLDRSRDAFAANTALAAEAETRYATTESQVAILKNTLTALAVDIGSVLLPVINSMVASMKPVVEAVRSWIAENPKLTSGIALVGAWLSALLVTLGPIVAGIGILIATVSTIGAPAAAAATAIGGITAAIAGIVAFVATDSKFSGPFKKAFGELADKAGEVIDEVVAIVGELTTFLTTVWTKTPIGEQFEIGFRVTVEIAATIIGAVIDVITAGLAALRAAISVATALITGDWRGVWEGIVEIVRQTFNAVGSVIGAAKDSIVNLVTTLTDSVKDRFQELGDALVFNSIVPDMMDAIQHQFGRLEGEAMKNPVDTSIAGTKLAFAGLETDLAGPTGSITKAVDSTVGKFEELHESTVGSTGIVTKTAVDLKSAFSGVGKDILDGLFSGGFNKENVGSILSGILDRFKNAFFEPLGKVIDNFISGGLNKLSNALGGLFGASPGGGGGGGGGASGAGSLFSGDPLTAGIAGAVSGIVSSAIGGIFGSGEGDRDNMISLLLQIKNLTNQHLHDVGYKQNDWMQAILGELIPIDEGINVGDGMKATLWQIRSLLDGGIALKPGEGGGSRAASSTEPVESAEPAGPSFRGGGIPTRARTGTVVEVEQPLPARGRTQTSAPEPVDLPGRARTESFAAQQQVDELADAVDELTRRNPLAVAAAAAGNPLAQLVTGGIIEPTANAITAVSDSVSEVATNIGAAISDTADRAATAALDTVNAILGVEREVSGLRTDFSSLVADGGFGGTVNLYVQGSVISEGELVDLIGKELDSRAAVR